LTVIAPEKVSPCAGLTVDKKSAARANYQFAFDANSDETLDDYKMLDIKNTLVASIPDAFAA
jgi:hypothetical protein